MAENQFSVNVPNVLQAIVAGEQGYKDMRGNVQENQKDQARKAAAQALSSGDPAASRNALAALLSAGDLQGANAVSNFGQQDWERGFRTTEAARTQSNADRSFGLQQQAANNPNIQKDENGNFIIINKQGTGGRQLPIEGQTQNNPYSYGKMNENQAKDSGYANRMFQSEGILRDPKLAEKSQSLLDRAADRMLPGDVANNFVSEGYQKYDQAARDFINATLRRESGAAISASEFDNAYKQYLPRPGDTKEVLAQKQKNRQATIASIAGGGGNNYKPPFSFGPSGEMVPTGNAQQGTRPLVPGQAAPPQAPQPQAAPQAPGPQNQPVKISSAQERDALPPGTSYIAPDGSLRTKQ